MSSWNSPTASSSSSTAGSSTKRAQARPTWSRSAAIWPDTRPRRHDAPALLARKNDVLDQGINLAGPAVAAEHSVMPDACLHVVALEIGAQAGAQIVRRDGLAG